MKCQAGKPPTVTRLLLLPDEAEEPPLSISREHFSTAIAFGFDLAEQLLFRGEEVIEEPHNPPSDLPESKLTSDSEQMNDS